LTVAGGCEGQLRYSYFISKHWGIFASLSADLASSGGTGYFRTLNYADGDKYKYSPCRNTSVLDYCLNSAIVGGVYRFDFGHWSLRPRVGIGIGSFEISSGGYERFSRTDDSAFPDYTTYSVNVKEQDFLMAGSSFYRYRSDWALVGYAGCQICYTFKRHFFLSAEIAVKGWYSPNITLTKKVVPAVTAYAPENWAEAVYTYDCRDSYKYNWDDVTETEASLPWAMCSVQIGVGWNIGWKRNDRN
ncbi:MAG: hypothetical protein ACI39U_01110, partial [Candidatus Cryptobacteroides sp.]